MDEEEATNASAVISPKIIIFMHCGRSERRSDDPEKFKVLYAAKTQILIWLFLIHDVFQKEIRERMKRP